MDLEKLRYPIGKFNPGEIKIEMLLSLFDARTHGYNSVVTFHLPMQDINSHSLLANAHSSRTYIDLSAFPTPPIFSSKANIGLYRLIDNPR